MTALRAYLRYVGPLTLLSILAFSPVLLLALRVGVPANAIAAQGTLRGAWVLAALGWIPLLVLVGPASAALDGGGQLVVLRAGFRRLLRAIVPCSAAVLAILVGALALAVPGAVLLVLFALTGASVANGVGPALAESVAAVRARPGTVIMVIAATVLAAGAILVALQLGVPMPLPKKPTAAQLTAFRTYVRLAIALIAVLAPVAAVSLATARRA